MFASLTCYKNERCSTTMEQLHLARKLCTKLVALLAVHVDASNQPTAWKRTSPTTYVQGPWSMSTVREVEER